MGGDDVVELGEMFQAQNDHERLAQLRVVRGGRVLRRLAQGQVEGKQRSEQVVLKALGLIAKRGRGGGRV